MIFFLVGSRAVSGSNVVNRGASQREEVSGSKVLGEGETVGPGKWVRGRCRFPFRPSMSAHVFGTTYEGYYRNRIECRISPPLFGKSR